MWSAIQDALGRYVQEFHTLIVERQQLNNERARLVAQQDCHAHRHQIEEYNKRLAIFNKRFARFQQPSDATTSLTDGVKHNVVTGYGWGNDDV